MLLSSSLEGVKQHYTGEVKQHILAAAYARKAFHSYWMCQGLHDVAKAPYSDGCFARLQFCIPAYATAARLVAPGRRKHALPNTAPTAAGCVIGTSPLC